LIVPANLSDIAGHDQPATNVIKQSAKHLNVSTIAAPSRASLHCHAAGKSASAQTVEASCSDCRLSR
jgi:hypothetical protein